jgi:hypothetical protein
VPAGESVRLSSSSHSGGGGDDNELWKELDGCDDGWAECCIVDDSDDSDCGRDCGQGLDRAQISASSDTEAAAAEGPAASGGAIAAGPATAADIPVAAKVAVESSGKALGKVEAAAEGSGVEAAQSPAGVIAPAKEAGSADKEAPVEARSPASEVPGGAEAPREANRAADEVALGADSSLLSVIAPGMEAGSAILGATAKAVLPAVEAAASGQEPGEAETATAGIAAEAGASTVGSMIKAAAGEGTPAGAVSVSMGVPAAIEIPAAEVGSVVEGSPTRTPAIPAATEGGAAVAGAIAVPQSAGPLESSNSPDAAEAAAGAGSIAGRIAPQNMEALSGATLPMETEDGAAVLEGKPAIAAVTAAAAVANEEPASVPAGMGCEGTASTGTRGASVRVAARGVSPAFLQA